MVARKLGGEDPLHDLPPEEKDQEEDALLEEAKRLLRKGKPRERKKKIARSTEISREKSKRAHQK
ncbi:MAG: hypothetical protein O7H41_20770 [Planctomycetota bacterium]|nr:hypothetical protein [Planctomycetota bacterium]